MPQDVAGALVALGLGRDATRSQVQRAFRARAFACHPDHGGDPAAFRRLMEAYRLALGVAAADPAPVPARNPYGWYERQRQSARVDVFDSPVTIRAAEVLTVDFADVLARHLAAAAAA
jgi:hypothetical protein